MTMTLPNAAQANQTRQTARLDRLPLLALSFSTLFCHGGIIA